MALAVANPMASKRTQAARTEGPFAEYTSIKIDVALIRPLKIAAAKAGKSIQEHASDLLNLALAEESGDKPLARLKPRPRGQPIKPAKPKD